MVDLRNLSTPESRIALLAVATCVGNGFIMGWAIGMALAAAQPVDKPAHGSWIVLT